MFWPSQFLPRGLQLTDWFGPCPVVACITNHPSDPRCAEANRIVMVITLRAWTAARGRAGGLRVTKSDYTSANSGYFPSGNVASLAPLVIGFGRRNDKKWPLSLPCLAPRSGEGARAPSE